MAKAYEYKVKPNIFDDLQMILDTMEVENRRRGNMRWLHYFLKEKNSDHPKYDDAMKLIEKLLYMDKPKKVNKKDRKR